MLLLPPSRSSAVVAAAQALSTSACSASRRLSLKELQRFTGKAVSCSLALPAGRLYLQRLYAAQKGNAHRRAVRLCHGALRDLFWWRQLTASPDVGQALWPPTLGRLTTDAPQYGWGGHWNNLVPARCFSSATHSPLHINVKEVEAVTQSILSLYPLCPIRDGAIDLVVDSRVALACINAFSSRSPAMTVALKRLYALCRTLGLTLRASWIASVANLWADKLSRDKDRTDWRLCSTLFSRLDARYGPHEVDLFASALNSHCARFYSRQASPECDAVDAMAQDWSVGNMWANPPFSLIPLVLNKAVADSATVTLNLPVWQSQPWWTEALGRAHEAFLLPCSAGVYSPGRHAGAFPGPTLASGRLPLCWRRQVVANAWHRDQTAALADAAGGSGLAAAALTELRDLSLRDVTAASYGAGWLRFCAFCEAGSYSPLPASPTTVGRYIAWQWLKGSVQPSSMRTYLSPVRKRHLVAEHPNPCATDLVAEAMAGFTNAWLDEHGSKPKRVALPASVSWRLAGLAFSSPDPTLRLRLSAIVANFFMCRRARDILSLTPEDVAFPAEGGLSFQIVRSKTDAKRPGGERLAHLYPASTFTTVPDLPVLLLRRVVAEHRRGRNAGTRLFPAASADPSTVLTAWLRAGLQILGVVPPVGCVYASHSNRSGGCTALRTVGAGLDAVAQWAGMSVDTLTRSYSDALATATPEAHFFFGRLIPQAIQLPA